MIDNAERPRRLFGGAVIVLTEATYNDELLDEVEDLEDGHVKGYDH